MNRLEMIMQSIVIGGMLMLFANSASACEPLILNPAFNPYDSSSEGYSDYAENSMAKFNATVAWHAREAEIAALTARHPECIAMWMHDPIRCEIFERQIIYPNSN